MEDTEKYKNNISCHLYAIPLSTKEALSSCRYPVRPGSREMRRNCILSISSQHHIAFDGGKTDAAPGRLARVDTMQVLKLQAGDIPCRLQQPGWSKVARLDRGC